MKASDILHQSCYKHRSDLKSAQGYLYHRHIEAAYGGRAKLKTRKPHRWQALRTCLAGGLQICASSQVDAQIPTRHIHFWIKSFIAAPKVRHTAAFSKTDQGAWVITAPLATVPLINHILPVGCFATDDRDFSSDPLASARATFEADLVASARHMTVEPFAGRNRVRIGQTRNVNCKTGADLSPPRCASDSSVSVGDIKSNQGGRLFVFNVRASVSDPFYDFYFISAPKLDFELVFNYDVVRQTITIQGSTGTFPSYEAYYSIDNGPIIKVLNRSPDPDAGAASLLDLGTGINTENFSEVIHLPL